MKNRLIRLALCLGIGLFSFTGFSQQYNAFDIRYQDNIKGDLTFIANNIVNRDGGTGSTEPEDPYNATGSSSTYNDWLDMQYIDVDNDPTTFSSSTATFTFPQANCNQIRYAGLYWSATYPSEQAGQAVGTNRQNDFNQVKFRVPGGTYVDITADEILYDGFTSTDNTMRQNSPYACYADVTALVAALGNPEGDYTIANVRSVTGSLSPGGGASGGWTLIIVYENPTLTGKLITTFDGFARVNSANSNVNIDYSGFNTIPVGPVNATIGAAALEGDNRITGDRMRIRAASSGSFTTISNATNPANNFFNSNITLNGVITTNRTPNSINTLGYDTDMFLLNNPANSVIPNNETDATFRFTSSGDQYYPFFNSFNVEIIEPEIVLEKRVEDIGGNDITGAGVNLGQYLDYVLSFVNIGNDDATNYTIRDVLPVNVSLDELNLILPTGVTYVYDAPTREIIFTIPDNLVEAGDPIAEIRMRVQVAENCFDFIDACTDQITNLAYSTYQGIINDNQITDDPSVSDFDNCGFVTPGATNFLLDDLENCDFTRTVQLCGEDVLLDAGDNFDSYTWYIDNNGDHLIDPGDTVITDGDPDGDPSTLLVSDTGTYIVDKDVADPCKGFQEIIIVTLFGATQTNPITDLINDTSNTVEGEIVACPNDGEELPQVFLCGLNDTELIQINIPDADSIVWEQLDEASCPAATPDCANKDDGCTWNAVGAGSDYLASDAGQYRLQINYQNGCFSRFYFNIFKNPLDPQYNSRDIICSSIGNITVTNMPVDYDFQLVDATNGNILVPYSDDNGPSFDITSNGAYRVEMRQQGVVDGCVFILDNIGILERNFQVDVTTRDTDCNGLGEISINVLDVEPQYYYEISQGGTVVDTYGPSDDNNYTFQNLNDGVYDVRVTTDDNCLYTEQVTIVDRTDLDVTASLTKNIDCTDGVITVTGSGGFPNPEYSYAIWSYVDESGTTQISYPDVASIPGTAYQSTNDFFFTNGEEGDYQFVVVDGNLCHHISNVVTIVVAPSVEYTTSQTDETCFGGADGTFTVNVTNTNGYSLSYTLTYPDTSTATNTSGAFTGLGQGDYSLTITQTQGAVSCDFIETFTIGGPIDGVTGAAELVDPYTCTQNGSIRAINVMGGTAPYEYSIDGVNFVSGATFSNLTDGTYTITIRDDSGCTFVTNAVTIDPLNPPTDLTFSATPPNCPSQTSDVTVTVVDGNTPYLFEIIAPVPIAATSISGNTADFDGLAPNTYTFRVTDDKGCIYTEDFTIDAVTPINVVGQLVQNVTCFNDTDGEVLFTVSGFNTNYDYTVTGPATFNGTNETNSTINLNGLDDGTYTIVVTDNETNCTATADVTVNAPAADLAIAAAETQPSCTADGSVILTATGGWGNNTFTLTNPDTTPFGTNSTGLFNNLTQTGTYTASVTDANGCTDSTTFTLNAAVAPVLQITPNDFCYDAAIGLTLTATVTSGGDGNFEYSLNGGAFDTNNIFAGLGAGTYTIDVRDGNDCTDSETITINPELTVTASAPNITACGTDTDIDITAAGGDGNFVYAVVADGVSPTPGDFATTNPVTVTGAGDYDVYVRDNAGGADYCEASFDITIAQDPSLVITPTLTHVSCFGGNNGAITLAASGGEAPYQYSIDNGANYEVTTDFSNLTAGSYTVRIRDANNCDISTVVTINEPAQLIAEAQPTQNYTCTQTGEITVGSVTPTSGGSGSYQYNINGGAWTPATPGGTTFTGLINGTYTIQVRDANEPSCFITLPAIVIDPLPNEPSLSFSETYNCDGTGNITVLPNDPAYTYSLDAGPFQSSNVFNNVAPGLHTVTVDYGNNCTTQANVNVESGHAFEANITAFSNISCNAGTDGSITFEVDNFGTGGFEYSFDNFTTVLGSSTTSPITLNNLSAGNYTLTVRDVDNPIAGCTVTLNQTLSEPTPVVASASLTSPATCTDGAVITASAAGGTPSYIYQLEDGVGGIIAGFDFATNGNNTVFTGLAVGDYIVRVRDANNCEDPIDTAITVTSANGITFTSAPTACYSGNNDGTIQVDVTAGNGDYQFSLDGGPWITPTPSTATTHTFTNLAAGTYTIDVRDGFGCIGVQQTVTINPQLIADAVLTNDLTCLVDATVTINASGGSGTYSYEWSNDGGTNYFTTNFTGNVFTTNTFGTFIFRVTDTTAPTACTAVSNSVTITEAQTPVITSVTPTHILCNGESTGVLDVVIDTSVGNPPYVINVVETSGPTNYGTQTSGLPAGNYEVTITDDKGCVSIPFPVTITEPNAITYDINLQPITCDAMGGGTTPGSITVENLAGGTAEYTYYLTGNNGHSDTYTTTAGGEDHTFGILEFGIYEVDVIDANGCSVVTTNIIASPPDDLDIDVSAVTASCAAGGTAIVSVSSTALGSGSYQFAILETYSAPYSSTYIGPDVPGGDTATFTGLVPGITYTFVVYDTVTNCYYFESAAAPINSPSNMTVTSLVEANVTCTGANDGNVTFTFDHFDVLATDVSYEIFNAQSNLTTGVTGTTAVNPPAGPVTVSNLGPLAPGVYFVLLREVGGPFDGCTIGSPDFTIDESTNALSVTATSTNASDCSADGTISAVAQFGTAPYLFQLEAFGNPVPTPATWTGTSTNGVFTGLANGNYTVYARDAYDCIQPFDITVGLDPRPEITIAVVDECADEGTFEVLVTLTNPGVASAPFQLSVNGGPSQNITFNGSNQYTVTGLSSGLGQTISVTDLNGCSDIDPFDIHPPLQFNAYVSTLLDCEVAPADNAEITIDVTAGSGNYDYEIDGPGAVDQARTAMGGNTITWTGASVAGSYTVTVYDTSTSVPNCWGSFVVDVPPVVTPNISIDAFTDVTCNGDDDGTITVSSTDVGIGPYTYEIISGPGSSAVFPIAPTSSSATSATFTGLEGTLAGITYTIRVTAANSCTDQTTQVIEQPDVITVPAPAVVEFGCTTGNNLNYATITVDDLAITGGSGTYVTYEFIEEDDPNTVPVEAPVVVQTSGNPVYIETDPAGGVYTINVYDDNGCQGSTTATIQPYDELLSATAAITNPLSCSPGSDGEITITVTSTNSDPTRFEYSIDNGATWQNTGTHTNPEIFTGLSAGTHNFLIHHIDTGCMITASETIADPNTFTIDANVLNDVICFGTQSGQVTFELIDATYSGPIDWEIFDTNGTPANTLDDTSVMTGSFATNGPTAPISLFAGDYYVEVTQTNFPQCAATEPFAIAGPPADITGAKQVTDITCAGNDGAIEIINAAGGWGNYSYYVSTTPNPDPNDPLNYVATPLFENLGPGTYEIWIIDQNGCPHQLLDETLADPVPITATLSITNPNCTNIEGAIEVSNPVGGQGSNYSFQLVRNGSNVGSPQTSRTFNNLGAGTYEVIVSDQWSCTLTTNAVVLYDEIVPSATVDKPIDCTVDPGGHVTITQTGGSGVFDYAVTFPDSSTPLPDVLASASATFTDLTMPGSYTFTITDTATGHVCVKTIAVLLDDRVDPILLDATITHVSCNGGSDGSILANLDPATDDNPPYQYELIGLAGAPSRPLQNSPLFTGLPAGDYDVRVVSSRGCEDIKTETITEPNALAASAVATPFACALDNTVNTSTVTITATDGTAPYLYSIDGVNFQTGNTFEIIDNGAVQNINFFVADANGCPFTDSITIQPLNTFTAAVSLDLGISCANDERVTITVTESIPGDVYTIDLLPVGNPTGTLVGNTNTTATFDISLPGSYTFRATNTTTGCYVDTAPYTIAPYDLIDVLATATAPAVCFGGAGTLEIDISGYSGTYDYEVFRSDNTSTGITGSGNTATNPLSITDPALIGGNYYVRVTETGNPLCVEDSNVITIVSPDMPLDATPVQVANVACTNDQGEIEVSPTGGYAPYDIVVTNTITLQVVYTVNDVVSQVVTGLSAGNYDIQITDDAGCSINRPLNLTQPLPITAGIDATPTSLACYGDTNATVTAINVINGEGIYQYQLNTYDAAGTAITFTSGPQSSPVFNNLGAGIYSITVSDGWNCGVETTQVAITEPTEVEASLIQLSPLTCNNQAQIELTASGGSGPYQFSTDGSAYSPMSGGNTHTFSVNAGVYQYYVRDAFGCEAMISNQVSVDAVPPLMIDIDHSAAMINCAGEASATIVANATGGLGNYSYELFSDAALTNLVGGPQNNDTFSGLPAGNYYVRVTSQDCIAVEAVSPIVDPVPLQIDREEFTDVTCSGEEDGTITVEVSGGTGQILYAITPNLNQFDTVNVFTDLAPGVYDVIAQDENGCFIPFQFTIAEPTPVSVTATNVLHEVCAGSEDGSIEIAISGGTAPYRASLNSNNDADFVDGQTLFSNLPAGNHVIFVRDAQDCDANIIVEINPGVNLNAMVVPIYECSGNIPDNRIEVLLEDASVSADVLYALDSTDPADMQLAPDFTNMTPGGHYLAIAHSNGCINTVDFEIIGFEPLTLSLQQGNINEIVAEAQGGLEDYTFYFGDVNNGTDNSFYINRTDTYTVTVVDQNGCEMSAEIFMEFIDIEIPNYFTPDGDGVNDYWLPDNLEAFPNALMIIFDRYGRELYRMRYGDTGWNGMYQNSNLPTGDYWYVIKLQGENDDRELVGHFTLYR